MTALPPVLRLQGHPPRFGLSLCHNVCMMQHLPLGVGRVDVHAQALHRLVRADTARRGAEDAPVRRPRLDSGAPHTSNGLVVTVRWCRLMAVRLGQKAARDAEPVLENCRPLVEGQLGRDPPVAALAPAARADGHAQRRVHLQLEGLGAEDAEDAVDGPQ
jgi:hypothetical protein